MAIMGFLYLCILCNKSRVELLTAKYSSSITKVTKWVYRLFERRRCLISIAMQEFLLSSSKEYVEPRLKNKQSFDLCWRPTPKGCCMVRINSLFMKAKLWCFFEATCLVTMVDMHKMLRQRPFVRPQKDSFPEIN